MNCALDGYEVMNAWPYVAALAGFALLPLCLLGRLKNALLNYKYLP